MRLKKITIIILPIALIFLNCHKESPLSYEFRETFAIYISDFDSNNQPLPELHKISLATEPLLTAQDITQYTWSIHQITFSKAVHDKLKTRGNLLHKIFIVIANGQRIKEI